MKKKIMPLEIFFSIIIIFSIVFIITIICLEININAQRINKKTEASRIASNIIENIKTRNYDDVGKYIEELSYVGMAKKIENNIQYVTIYGNQFSENFFGTQIPDDYTVEFQSENYGSSFDVQKKISITIGYNIKQKNEEFNVSTILERENVKECNTPIISDEYFKELGFLENAYEIIPIKYSESKDCYIVTTKDDLEWYNYSAKDWAKVVVFPKKEIDIKNIFIRRKWNC